MHIKRINKPNRDRFRSRGTITMSCEYGEAFIYSSNSEDTEEPQQQPVQAKDNQKAA